MSAGSAEFTIEQGADWAVQVYWVGEQTGQPIPMRTPMTMDIVSPVTGQRLIRLDDGANGGINRGGGAEFGVIDLTIDHDTTIGFMPGSYVYDLYVSTTALRNATGDIVLGKQRVRLLTGSVQVSPTVSDIGLAVGQAAAPGILPPDIWLDTHDNGTQTVIVFDPLEPTNIYQHPEYGKPLRAGVRGAGGYPNGHPLMYNNPTTTLGPVVDPYNNPLQSNNMNLWLSIGAIITIQYVDQTGGLIVKKVESEPGHAPSPPTREAVNA